MCVFAGRFTVFALTIPDDLRFTSRRISVRGLTLQCAIGAYEHERNRLQQIVKVIQKIGRIQILSYFLVMIQYK